MGMFIFMLVIAVVAITCFVLDMMGYPKRKG